MKSLIITPKNQTGKTVLQTVITISDTSDFTNILFTNTQAGDHDTIILEEAFINIPLFVKIVKQLEDGTNVEYIDTNPVIRGNTLVVRESEFNTNIDVSVVATITPSSKDLVLTVDRVCDYLHVTMYDMHTNKPIDSVFSTTNTCNIKLKNINYPKGKALLNINASNKGIKYHTTNVLEDVDTSINVNNLRERYYLDTDTSIVVLNNGNTYSLKVDDANIPFTSTNKYDLRPYIIYGAEHSLVIEFSNGYTFRHDFKTINSLAGYNDAMVVEGVLTELKLQIDKTLINNPFYGELIVNAMFYLKNEDNKEKLFSYYIPGDKSMRLDTDFQHGNKIIKVFKIDDRNLAIISYDGTTYKLIRYSYYLVPLTVSELGNIAIDYEPCNLAYINHLNVFYHISGTLFNKIGENNVATTIPTPVPFTKGYLSQSSLTDILVILDEVVYVYDGLTNDWDTIKTLDTAFIAKGFKQMISIPEGVLIVHADNTLSKYYKDSSDIIDMDITINDLESIFTSNHNIFYTKTNDTKIYALS